MKNYSGNFLLIVLTTLFVLTNCTTSRRLAYLDNLTEEDNKKLFPTEVPEYKLQPRDILYITVKAMTPDGTINDFLTSTRLYGGTYLGQTEGTGYIYGYDINTDGNIILPVIGEIKVAGLTLEETRKLLQEKAEQIFRGSTVECKLLSFKFTVIGEVRAPGSYINYNNYLTVLEAIGRAGGVGDYGNRNRVLVIRSSEKGTKTFTLNLQDKNILSSEGYFLLPNDVVIVEPLKHKIFNMNLPTFSFVITSVTSAITTTLLLINYFKK